MSQWIIMGGIDLSDAICENCGNLFEECTCTCPYCGETSLCDCCIGTNSITGG